MSKRKLGALEKIDADLPNLQYRIRRDAQSYEGDFLKQYSVYQDMLELISKSPSSTSGETLECFRDLVDFVTHVAECYPRITADFPLQLTGLLIGQQDEMNLGLKEKLVASLVLLRKKRMLDSTRLLNVLVPILVSTPSKRLRTTIYGKIISEVRSSNANTTHLKLNRSLQTALYSLIITGGSSPNAIWAVRITRELWRRQVWTDSKAVDIMREAALVEHVKVITGAVTFFLGGDKDREELAEQSSGDEAEVDIGKLRHQAAVTRKTRKKEKSLKAAAATKKRRARKKNRSGVTNFSALHLLNDPQTFAELLFSRHLQNPRSKLNLEQKLLVLQLVTRLIGLHELTILNLYSYFIKYLTPRQNSVTSFLASLSQSVHRRIPPDIIEPLVVKIANEFVSEGASGQVAAAGLNTIREICMRQPLVMNEVLLQDLVMYRRSKDKGVMMAARGLLSLYREVGPDKLKRRDRGKDASMDLKYGLQKEQRFGEEEIGGIRGLELLESWKEEESRKEQLKAVPASGHENFSRGFGDQLELDEDDWKAWEVNECDSEDSGGWIDVHSDGENIDVSESDGDADDYDDASGYHRRRADQSGLSKSHEPLGKSPKDVQNASETSQLATTKILTPADLRKINELRLQAVAKSRSAQSRKRAGHSLEDRRHKDDPLTAGEIEAMSSIGKKTTKEDKISSAKADRSEQHQSVASRRREKKREAGKSTTNKDKARKKNIMMTLGKAKGKQKRSLVETRKVLKGHVQRQKRGGRSNNG